jgi:5'-3' exonuclease
MKQPIKKSRAVANGVSNKEAIYSLVVDGNNLLKISLVDKTMNSSGQEYGAVVSFLRILGTILNKKDFNYCTVCWDGTGSGVLRWKLYEDYKANRDKHYELHDPNLSDYEKKLIAYQKMVLDYNANKLKKEEELSFKRQKSIISSILEELCVRQYEFENVEGDDVISYCVKNRQENEKVVIVSSDKDLTQLICEDVIVYNPRMKDFITKDNSVEKIGITHENVVLEKILCGDVSDNIKGVKGIGEQTLIKLFPQIKTEKMNLEAVIARSKELLEERKEQKKKPLKSLENIVNGITDGCQGDKLYEINQKIIDLSEPLMTDEAVKELSDVLYAPIDTSDRDMKNVYMIINENEMSQLSDENKFSEVFSPYSRIIMMEKRRFKEFLG